MRRSAAVLACALAAACPPAVAHGAAATGAELRALAGAAQRDPAALRRLRAVDVVDGRPAALARVLRGTQADVRARLRALAQDDAAGAPQPTGARDEARDVLAERRFAPTEVPAPLRGVRERIGDALRSLGRPLQDAFEWVASRLPGGAVALWALIGAAALAAGAALAARAGGRRSGARARDGAFSGGDEERLSATRLRQEADAAERRGDLDAALRLRFRAGLVELDRRGIIELRPGLTNRELLRAVPSPALGDLVDGFEAVAYGGRPARQDDLSSARAGWPRALGEASAR